MKHLDLTLPTPEENLAADEALLDARETGSMDGDVLRFWESPTPFVVVGYSNHLAREANLDACRDAGVPVLRRCTGGGTVVQGPGCLNYTLILRIPATGPLATLAGTNHFIMQRHADALRPLLGDNVRATGTTDLALGDRKFSGNAQRRKRKFLLFHGTFLIGFDLALVARLLHFPSRQPDYRQSRSHLDFVTNIPLTRDAVKGALRDAWRADEPLREISTDIPAARYSTDEWNLKFP